MKSNLLMFLLLLVLTDVMFLGLNAYHAFYLAACENVVNIFIFSIIGYCVTKLQDKSQYISTKDEPV